MLRLSSEIGFKVVSADETVLDVTVTVSRLKKKQQKKLAKMVESAQAKLQDGVGVSDGMTELDLAAKERFKMQVSGEGVKKLSEFAEEYGYQAVMNEIDALVSDAEGKR